MEKGEETAGVDDGTRQKTEYEVDLKIRQFIKNSPPVHSNKLNINRLKCFHDAAKTLFSKQSYQCEANNNNNKNNVIPAILLPLNIHNKSDTKFAKIFFILNTLVYTKVQKSIELYANNNTNNIQHNKFNNNNTVTKIDTNSEINILVSMYDKILNQKRRTDKEMHTFLSKKIFPYMFYAAYVITKEVARKSTYKGEIVVRIFELGFGFSDSVTKHLKTTMESMKHSNEINKQRIKEKVQILRTLNENLFKQKNRLMQDEFEKQKTLSVMIRQVDKKIEDRMKKKKEMVKALAAVKKLHKMFLSRTSSKIVEHGRQKLFRAMSKINASNLIESIQFKLQDSEEQKKIKSNEKLNLLVSQINNSTNNIYKMITSKLKKQLPYAPHKISRGTNTNEVDLLNENQHHILQTSKKIWYKDESGDSNKWVVRQVGHRDYVSYVAEEILKSIDTTLRLYSKPHLISKSRLLGLIIEIYLFYVKEKLYKNKNAELDEACYKFFKSKYRIKKITAEKFVDFLFSIRKSCGTHTRILKFFQHISKKSIDEMVHNVATVSHGNNGINNDASLSMTPSNENKVRIIYKITKEESIFRYGNILKQLEEMQPGKCFMMTDSGEIYIMTQTVLNVIRNNISYLPTNSKLKIEAEIIKNRTNIDIATTLPKKYYDSLEKLERNGTLEDVIDLDFVLPFLSSEEEKESNIIHARLHRIYYAADSDNSDDLSFKEFKVLMTSLNPLYKPEEIGAMYRQCLEFDLKLVDRAKQHNNHDAKGETIKKNELNEKDQLLNNVVNCSNFVGSMSKLGIMSTSYMQQLASQKIGLFFTTKYKFVVPNITTIKQLNKEWTIYGKSAREMLEYLDVNANTASDAWHVLDNKHRLIHFERILQRALNGDGTFQLAFDTYRLMRFQIETLIAARTKLVSALGPLRMLIKFKRKVLKSLETMKKSAAVVDNDVDVNNSNNEKYKNMIKMLFSNCRWNKIDDVLGIIEDENLSMNVKNSKGATLLHVAAQNGHKDLAKLLCDLGASVDKKDGKGLMPIDYAMQYKYLNIVEILRTIDKEKN